MFLFGLCLARKQRLATEVTEEKIQGNPKPEGSARLNICALQVSSMSNQDTQPRGGDQDRNQGLNGDATWHSPSADSVTLLLRMIGINTPPHRFGEG